MWGNYSHKHPVLMVQVKPNHPKPNKLRPENSKNVFQYMALHPMKRRSFGVCIYRWRNTRESLSRSKPDPSHLVLRELFQRILPVRIVVDKQVRSCRGPALCSLSQKG